MNSGLKYFLTIIVSVTIGFLIGQRTLNQISTDSLKMKADSLGREKESTNNSNATAHQDRAKSKMEPFYEYIGKFFLDSAFQKTRITFPLEVSTPINNYDSDTTRLSISDWRFIKRENILIVYDDFGCVNRDCDTDQIMITERGFLNTVFYDFKRIEGNWYLIKVHENAELGHEKFRQ